MTTSIQENEELVHRFVDAINHQDGDALNEWLAEDLGAMQQLGVVEPPGE